MASQFIELHDTQVERIEVLGSQARLHLSAYVHESDGPPGVFGSDRGWFQPFLLTLDDVQFETGRELPKLWIIDGVVKVGGESFDNIVPLPFDRAGSTRVVFDGANDSLVVRGTAVRFLPAGPPERIRGPGRR